MILRNWNAESPKRGTYTVFNLTEYSSGESEATVTTVKDTVLKRPKLKKTVEQIDLAHDALLDSDPLKGKDALLFLDQFTKEKSAIDKEENKTRSMRRTRSVIRKKIIEGNLDHFLTLTYKENKLDLKECWADWKKFIRLVQKKYPTLKYLVVVERQKRGAVHFHIAIHGFLHANTIRRLWLSVVGEGNIDIKRKKRNQSLHNLAKYMTKYITKQYDELDSFKNLYRCSRNIKLKITKFYLPKEYAMFRAEQIKHALDHYIGEIKQFWEDSNGLYSCQWASSLAP
jgi:hypothetical protein